MAIRPVYSVQILCVAPALPSQTVTVPDDVRIIVRDIDARAESGATGDEIAVYNAAGGILWPAKVFAGADPFHYQWSGRQVYNPGDELRVVVFAGTWSVAISGYELSLT